MDTSLILQIIVVLGAILLGVRLGGMAIGYTGGLGVAVLALGLGLAPGHIPHDVILIIMAVIAAIAALQLAGGLDYLVRMAEKYFAQKPEKHQFLSAHGHLFSHHFGGHRPHGLFDDACDCGGGQK